MSARFTVNHAELDALSGLPLAARVAYLEGIKPYMDFATGIVGAAGRPGKSISLQSLTEVLFVEPKQGRKDTGSRSRKQARVCIEILVDAGLIMSMSISKKHDKRLVLKCILADTDTSVQKKQGTNRAQEQGTNRAQDEASNSNDLVVTDNTKEGIPETPNQGTPPVTYQTDTDRQTPRAREKKVIPDGFAIDEQMKVLLKMAGISMEQAEFMLVLFVSDNQKSQYSSNNWHREFIDYIRRFWWKWEQHRQGKHLVPVMSSGGRAGKSSSDVAKGFTTMEDYGDGDV